ncbi:MAG: response regulator [Candidatus Eremiobacteraeota bacterium]|nr:response regulator [Candidatus Eremiobacteraeota bacterium]
MPPSEKVLIVEYNMRNLELITGFLRGEGYEVTGAATMEELDEILKAPGMIGLALIDLVGFDQRIWERSEILREMNIPFIIISLVKTAALGRGECAVLLKPLVVKDMLSIVSTFFQEAAR